MPPRNSSQELHKERYNSDFFTATASPLHQVQVVHCTLPTCTVSMTFKHRLFSPYRFRPTNPNMLPVVYRVVYRAISSGDQPRRVLPFQHTYAECRWVTD